jgi:type VI secretion system protein ImpC
MPSPQARSQVVLDVGIGEKPLRTRPEPDTPFHIAILGALRGHASGGQALAERPSVLVDRDNFDDVLARLAPALEIQLGERGPPITLRFEELDDFHPDRIYERLPLFRSLRDLRRDLADPRSFSAAARALQGGTDTPAEKAAPSVTPAGPDGNVLDQILAETTGPAPEQTSSTASAARDELQEFLRRAVAPYLVPGRDPRQAELLSQVDAAIGTQMRDLLHHPDFQALESLWRGVFFLVRRLETGGRLRVYLFDAGRDEIASDLAAGSEPARSDSYRMLTASSGEAHGDEPWAVLTADMSFGAAVEDTEMLSRLAQLASAVGAPWISAAAPALVDLDSFASLPDASRGEMPEYPAWEAFRRTPQASHLALVAPRFLLRLPYGEQTDPCEHFEFEEMPAAPVHAHYLWGNPALACALLLGESFSEAGWELRPGTRREIGGLPLHLLRTDGETTLLPCAETLLTERAAARLMDAGVMPLASLKDRDAVLLVRFQSVALPTAALAGRWGTSGIASG